MSSIDGFMKATPKTIINALGVLLCMFLFPDEVAAQPTFVTFPPNVTVDCDNIPTPVPPQAGGSCLPVNVCLSLESYIPGPCPNSKILLREWTAKDNCGQTTTKTQQIDIVDKKAPKMSFTRYELLNNKHNDTLVLDCRYAYGLKPSNVLALDNCDPNPTVVLKDNAVKVGNCKKDGFVLFMHCSWIATDACGNKSELGVYIRFIDITPPDVWNIPPAITVDCESAIDDKQVPEFKDYCDGQPYLKEMRSVIPGTCAGTYNILRNWEIGDLCGNIRTASQLVKIEDKRPPFIKTRPGEITISYNQPFPPAPQIEVTDYCQQKVEMTLSESRVLSGCDTILTRRWTATDLCGNTAAVAQKITKIAQAAKISQLQADQSVVCLRNANAVLSAHTTSAEVKPFGLEKIYLLCDKNQMVIGTSSNALFTVSETGKYTIYSLMHDSRFDPSTLTSGDKSLSNVIQQLSSTCAAWDTKGVDFKVEICDIMPVDSVGCVKPNVMNISIKNPDCGESNGNICLEVSPPDAIFLWDTNGSTSACISDISAGKYTVRISDKDNPFCFTEKSITVSDEADFGDTNPTITAATCSGKDGSAEFRNASLEYLWSDGSTLSKRTDLSSGKYIVTITKSSGSCRKLVEVDIPLNGLLIASAEIIRRPDCRDNNGAVRINVSGGSGNYTFSAPSSNNIIDKLPAGSYLITVTDNVSGCTEKVQFTLSNDSLVKGIINVSVTPIKCAGDFTKLNASLNLPAGFALPATLLVVNSDNKIVDTSRLRPGNYTILLFDKNQCLKSHEELKISGRSEIVINYSTTEALCRGNINVRVQGGVAPYHYDWADISGNNEPIDRNDLKPGNYKLIVSDSNNCSVQINPVIGSRTCADTCINWFSQHQYQLQSNDCANGTEWCTKIPYSTFVSSVKWYLNDKLQTTAPDSCGQFAKLKLPVGKLQLVFSQKRGTNTCLDTINVNVSCDNCPIIYKGKSDVNADSCNGTATICLNISKTYLSQLKISVNGNPFTGTIGDCGNGNAALFFSPGNYQIIFRDTIWSCTSNLNLTVGCDTLKNGALKSDTIEKDIFIGDTFTHCLDTSELNRGPYTVSNICAVPNKAIEYTVNGLCLTIKGDTIGNAKLCMVVCDPHMRCDTTYVIIHVIPKKAATGVDTIYREIVKGKSDTVYVNTRGLGMINNIYNYCPGESGKSVSFEITAAKVYIKYSGLEVGLEKGCFVICDKQGKCDTTIVYVKCKKDSTGRPPIAVIDFASTKTEKMVSIDILKNDTINGTLKMLGFYKTPRKGLAYIVQDNNGHMSVVYMPNQGICGTVDTFSYFIENENGRDTALVLVTINCQQLIIFDGFSPNGDGINDTFTIQGIEEFPENDLFIANRWGNQVFFTKGYSNQNGWDGTWDGSPLPDGTYYYCLRLLKVNKIYSGYLELRR